MTVPMRAVVNDRPMTRGSRPAGAPTATGIVLAVMAVVTMLAIFVYIAVAVAGEGRLVLWDRQVTEWMTAGRTDGWSRVWWGLSLLGNTPVMAVLTALSTLLLLLWGRRAGAILVAAAALSATGVSQLLKALLERERPAEIMALIETPVSHSLPSGHALSTAVFLGMLVFVTVGVGRGAAATVATGVAALPAVVMGSAIGYSRVYLGVHWTSDVVAGWCVGVIWVIVLVAVFRRAERSRFVVPDVLPWGRPAQRVLVSVLLVVPVAAVVVAEGLAQPLLR